MKEEENLDLSLLELHIIQILLQIIDIKSRLKESLKNHRKCSRAKKVESGLLHN